MLLTATDSQLKPTVNPGTTTKVVLVIEYDGTRYYGFQWQANLPTIQGALEEAIRQLTGENLRLLGASRTDTGVHARGQVISFRTKSTLPLPTLISGLNHYLPQDIAVKTAHRARANFSVRSNAISREYRYCILNNQIRSPLNTGFSYLVTRPLDIEAMDQTCRLLVGEHDFASFASSLGPRLRNTVRTVYRSGVRKEGDSVLFEIVANSFLPHQIRNTTGALIRVGLGKMKEDEFYSIMVAGKPGLAGPSAPACGLFLMRVNYPQPFEEETE
ncbi:MAG: tRNA pseudouridine(38-40) synthase TruA [Chloroflexota bacterium]